MPVPHIGRSSPSACKEAKQSIKRVRIVDFGFTVALRVKKPKSTKEGIYQEFETIA
jgi:hypothetical protein